MILYGFVKRMLRDCVVFIAFYAHPNRCVDDDVVDAVTSRSFVKVRFSLSIIPTFMFMGIDGIVTTLSVAF